MPLPDIPAFGQSDTEFRRFWNAVREWTQVRQGVRGRLSDAFVSEARLKDLGITEINPSGHYVRATPLEIVTALPTLVAYAHASSGTATASITVTPDGLLLATGGVTKRWALNAQDVDGRDYSVKYRLLDSAQPAPGAGTLDTFQRLSVARTLSAQASGVATRTTIQGVYTVAQYANATNAPRVGEGLFILVAESQMPSGGIPI